MNSKFKMLLTVSLMVFMMGANLSYTEDERGFFYGSIDLALISDAEARRGGGFRGGGSRGFKSYSRPKARPSPSKTRKPNKTVNRKSTKKATTNSRPKTRFASSTQRASSERSSKALYAKTKAKFKKPTTTATTASSKTVPTVSNKMTQNASRNDSRTYYSRRDSYYSGYSTPTYVYAGQSSYGMWDSIFLYSMMSNSSFGYHHSNNAGYSEWRREANELSQTNADLKKQLDAMDAKIAGIDPKTKVDPNFLPKGVDADIPLATQVLEDMKPEMRICTGQSDGTYKTVGKIYSNIATNLNVTVVETNGSIDNLEKINSGVCDVALVQRDAYWVYLDKHPKAKLPVERVSSPYDEYVHMVCNTGNDVEEVDDLTSSNTLYVGIEGSGSEVTWNNFVAENDAYASVNVVKATNLEARMKITSEKDSCALYVGALGAPVQFS